MYITDGVASIFGAAYLLNEKHENNSEFKCFYAVNEPHKPNSSELENVLSAIPERDNFILNCKIDGLDDCVLRKNDTNSIKRFLEDLDTKLILRDEGDTVSLYISIEKNRVNGKISVYSLIDLVEFWEKDGVVSSLKKIQEIARCANTLLVFGLEAECNTNLISFVPFLKDDHTFSRIIDPKDIHSKRDKAGHFANASQFSLVPEDFHFDVTPPYSKLANLFKELRLITSLVYLCDFSKFDEDGGIHLRLNGYRLFSKDIASSKRVLSNSNSEYFDIYTWAYGEGDVIDKVGLARNVISLHLNNDDLVDIQRGTLQSISSGYQIYLKENVKQYIEIKNKLSEFIQSSSDKASDIAKNLGGYYKNSIWTMYSFFASVFLIRVISKSQDNLVTNEIYALFIAFSIITVIIMKYALKELEGDKQRFIDSYERLKDRYSDLLLPEDLEKILASDKQHNADVEYICKKKSDFRMLWGLSLGLIFIVMSLLWASGK